MRVVPLLVTACLLTMVIGCGATPERSGAGPERSRPQVVMFIGDSFASGWGSVPPERSYATETARRLRWQIIVAAAPGTGLVARGRVGKDFSQIFERELAWRPRPDLLVVSGGHNDRRHPPEKVAAGTTRLLERIRHRWPRVPVVLVGPIWIGDAPAAGRRVRDAIAGVAVRAGVPFIDPIGEEWIKGDPRAGTGEAAQLALKDGVHPTAEGHMRLAEWLSAGVRRVTRS
ncbi:SGNH/GDSL hydrolase family protein [Rhizohabitans arisaemae]|uniref:SGNH/GDSL hydrolase family protein n=1 Tax=Rhizohabitans arisaemae TaxID=2720610 RepID=UPI0024B19B93|nr:SGNH/GDSL hydrolase family protein [Rhizohabitans arisaemae]